MVENHILESVQGPFGALAILIIAVTSVAAMYRRKDSELIAILKEETKECRSNYASLLMMYNDQGKTINELTAKVAKLEAKLEAR